MIPRHVKQSAAQKGLEPVKFIPAVIIEPTKEQLQSDRKLIEDHIAKHGVKVCPPAYFVPMDHDFNRVGRPKGST